MHVLIAEDDDEVRKVMVSLFERAGHTVQTASFVTSALVFAAYGAYDAIVSDLNFGVGLTGMDLHAQLADLGQLPHFVFFTTDVEAPVQAGLCVVPKPDFGSLLLAVEEGLQTNG